MIKSEIITPNFEDWALNILSVNQQDVDYCFFKDVEEALKMAYNQGYALGKRESNSSYGFKGVF